MNIKKFLFIFILIFGIALNADVKYSEFIDAQIKLVYEINDANGSQDKIQRLLHKQEAMYESELNRLMYDKQAYLNSLKQYDTEMFSLKKIISINKRRGNSYAVIRDEVQLKSYTLVKNQNIMIKKIILALDAPSIEEFENRLNEYIAANQNEIQKLYLDDYQHILDIDSNSKILKKAKQNIREFYALRDVNSDFIAYLYKFDTKMYRLNKYSKYHLIKFAIFVNSIAIVQILNPVLEIYGLNVIKLLLIAFLILVIYLFRKIIYVALESYILKAGFLKKYSKEILEKIRSLIEMVIIIINVNMVIYVYNDFSSIEMISRAFNIIYGFYFTFIVYKVVNTVAAIKLSKLHSEKTQVKSDLINVGLKILNFIIIMIGLLIMLYFAGVNLTAVLSGLGIGGFAVAFAAKDTISNFFGTLSILFSDVFSQGDWIEIDGKEGVVVEIGLRVTTIRTFDNALIAIPNGTFANKEVKNWNKRKLGRRIKMKIGVKYDSKAEDLKNAVKDIRSMLQNHPDIATKETKYEFEECVSNMVKLVSKDDLEGVKRTLLVYLDEFSDSSIDILIYCFTKSVRWEDWLATKEDVMHKIMKILEQNSLEFAFPSLSIYNENVTQDK